MERSELIAAHANGLKSSIHALEVQVTILKQLVGSTSEGTETDDAAETAAAPKKRGRPAKTAAASFDDDTDTGTEKEETETDDEDEFGRSKKAVAAKHGKSFGDDDEEEEAEEKPAKAAKSKKGPTADDVNDACMARAERTNRDEVMTILKKFKVKSVKDLEESDFEECIKLLKGRAVK